MERLHLEREEGVVDEDIDAGKFFPDRLGHLLHLLSFRHVCLKDHSLRALFFYLLEDFQGPVAALVVVNDHRGSPLGQPLGRGCSDTPARPGYKNDLAAEGLKSLLLHH